MNEVAGNNFRGFIWKWKALLNPEKITDIKCSENNYRVIYGIVVYQSEVIKRQTEMRNEL